VLAVAPVLEVLKQKLTGACVCSTVSHAGKDIWPLDAALIGNNGVLRRSKSVNPRSLKLINSAINFIILSNYTSFLGWKLHISTTKATTPRSCEQQVEGGSTLITLIDHWQQAVLLIIAGGSNRSLAAGSNQSLATVIDWLQQLVGLNQLFVLSKWGGRVMLYGAGAGWTVYFSFFPWPNWGISLVTTKLKIFYVSVFVTGPNGKSKTTKTKQVFCFGFGRMVR
jgi:hypothetical protein